mgnify:CR=1 FL=1
MGDEMGAFRWMILSGLVLVAAGCKSQETAAYCGGTHSCTGCALTADELGVCNDKGTHKCAGDASRCANECIHNAGSAYCGHPGCACSVACGCS